MLLLLRIPTNSSSNASRSNAELNRWNCATFTSFEKESKFRHGSSSPDSVSTWLRLVISDHEWLSRVLQQLRPQPPCSRLRRLVSMRLYQLRREDNTQREVAWSLPDDRSRLKVINRQLLKALDSEFASNSFAHGWLGEHWGVKWIISIALPSLRWPKGSVFRNIWVQK